MSRISLLACVGATVVAFAAMPSTQAHSFRGCKPAVEGSAAGLGVLGRGERRAGLKARADWEQNAKALYGEKFARLANARGVVWDCKGGTLAPAKCTVRARPCRS
jgi:hypothetical protein